MKRCVLFGREFRYIQNPIRFVLVWDLCIACYYLANKYHTADEKNFNYRRCYNCWVFAIFLSQTTRQRVGLWNIYCVTLTIFKSNCSKRDCLWSLYGVKQAGGGQGGGGGGLNGSYRFHYILLITLQGGGGGGRGWCGGITINLYTVNCRLRNSLITNKLRILLVTTITDYELNLPSQGRLRC